MSVRTLGRSDIAALAERLDIRPTKKLGQNFVHDGNTVRRIVAAADVRAEDHALEVGPGLGSLTLGLLDVAAKVTAIEIDPVLARQLPITAAERAPGRELRVIEHDALTVRGADLGGPTVLVANLPYNVAVPVLLHLLAEVPTLRTALVMVQWEVAERLAAQPGNKTYGVPSVKARYFGSVKTAGTIGRQVFWPEPNVESGLVRIDRHPQSPWPDLIPDLGDQARRVELFTLVDAAFSQRRKMLRSALAGWAGSPAAAIERLEAAGIDPTLRGERLGVAEFVALAATAPVE